MEREGRFGKGRESPVGLAAALLHPFELYIV